MSVPVHAHPGLGDGGDARGTQEGGRVSELHATRDRLRELLEQSQEQSPMNRGQFDYDVDAMVSAVEDWLVEAGR